MLVYLDKRIRKAARKTEYDRVYFADILQENCVKPRNPEGIWLNSDPVSSREESRRVCQGEVMLCTYDQSCICKDLYIFWRSSRFEIIFLTVLNVNHVRKVCWQTVGWLHCLVIRSQTETKTSGNGRLCNSRRTSFVL